jgi:hypothetical protein
MSIKSSILAVSVLVLASCSSGGGAPSSESSESPVVKSREEWRKDMAKIAPSREGCFVASHPSATWVEVPCAKSADRPPVPLAPRRGAPPLTVGDGVDFSAQESGLISGAEGTFPLVSGVTSTTDQFSLQLNSNYASTLPYCFQNPQDPLPNPPCQEWQQFAYLPGEIFMQYWLIGVTGACPQSWTAYNNGGQADCYRNSDSVLPVPDLKLTDLGKITLGGAAGTTDHVTLSTGDGNLYLLNQASLVDLNQWWSAAEFNVFGPGDGSEVDFNPGSTLLVRTWTGTPTPGAVPTCLAEGFTGETNNLNLLPMVYGLPALSCCPLQGQSPGIQFTESNVPGAVAPACPPVDCSPSTCFPGMCGVQSDTCGGQIDCGGCGQGQACQAGQCVNTSCAAQRCPIGFVWHGVPECQCVPNGHHCACGGVYPNCRECQ